MPPLKIGIAIAGLPMPLKKALGQAAEWVADAVQIDARRQLTPGQLSETGAAAIAEDAGRSGFAGGVRRLSYPPGL